MEPAVRVQLAGLGEDNRQEGLCRRPSPHPLRPLLEAQFERATWRSQIHGGSGSTTSFPRCKMFPDVEATAGAAAMVMPSASHKGSSGGFEMAGGETGGCDCTTCKCGTACGCSCWPESSRRQRRPAEVRTRMRRTSNQPSKHHHRFATKPISISLPRPTLRMRSPSTQQYFFESCI
ncbi:hypothetical protein ZWY2020_052174 [Hordeum vulgare]|nr:hypothetical protein ZWY2020_052174 [Hordeum vulgare]